MTDSVSMGRIPARGGFNFFLGLAVSTAVSAVGVVIIAKLLSPSEYGLVAISLIA